MKQNDEDNTKRGEKTARAAAFSHGECVGKGVKDSPKTGSELVLSLPGGALVGWYGRREPSGKKISVTKKKLPLWGINRKAITLEEGEKGPEGT